MHTSTAKERWLLPALMGCVLFAYLPFAGNAGLWDPWETHFGEVARQMAVRGDAITLHYPASPVESASFYSKPVLTFWLEAPLLWLLRATDAQTIATTWRAEWACRLPAILLALATIAALFSIVRRLVDERAALLCAAILATCPIWLLIARQAMTDMPFVAPMTIALLLVARSLLDDDAPASRVGKASLLFTLCVCAVPLVLITAQLRLHVAMLPYWLALAGAVALVVRAQSRRTLELMGAWIACALATLAKGPAGLALPAIIIGVYLIIERRGMDIVRRLALAPGLLLFVAVAFPWYHAMHLRHGMPFWNELIGDNYVNRAMGRHGDRGTFEYYVEWCAYGMFPWCGLAAVGALRAFANREQTPRARLIRLCAVWLLVDWAVITLVRTKFHHYALPMIPPLAILAGLYLDELLGGARKLALYLVALPVMLLVALTLPQLPQRLTWLFDYDYVNMPGLGRPWPSLAIYGDRYEYGALLLVLGLLAVVTLLFVRRTAMNATRPWLLWLVPFAVALAIFYGPSTDGHAPDASKWRWLIPFVLALPWSLWLAWRSGARALFIAALAFNLFVVDHMIVELAPHWSQKHVIASYYRLRASADEPLLVWRLFWHGENFYTANQIYEASDANERTVFLTDKADDLLRTYLARHAGRRVYFLVERVQLEHLKTVVGASVASSMHIVDESNNKLVLVEGRS